MTQPQYYLDPATGQYVLASAPQQPAPQAPPAYAPPMPPQGAPAQQYAYQAPGFPPQVYPGQPAYGMPAQYPGAPAGPPAPPLAEGSLADFYSQRSVGGGKALSWDQKPIGFSYTIRVTREITKGDVEQTTKFRTKEPDFHTDGRPKFQLKVPGQLVPTQEYPDGLCQWYVKGATRDELNRAMGEAGVQPGPDGNPQPPQAGSIIQITLAGKRPVRGLNDANVIKVRYWQPSDPYAIQMADFLGAQQAAQPVAAPHVMQQPYPVAQPAPYAPQMPAQPVYPPTAHLYAPQTPAAPVPTPPAPAPAQTAPSPAPAPTGQPMPPVPVASTPPATPPWQTAPGVPQLDDAQQAQLAALLAQQAANGAQTPPAPPAG